MRVGIFIIAALFTQACVTGMQRPHSGKSAPEPELSDSYYRPSTASEPVPMKDDERSHDLPEPKKKVIVFQFWNDTPINDEALGSFAADLVRKSLFDSGEVLIPSESTEMPETKNFVSGQKVKVSQLIREGRKQGASVVVIGRIAKAQYRHKGEDVGILRQSKSSVLVELEMKLFDVAAGREIFASTHTGQSQSKSFIALESSPTTVEFKSELAKEALKEAVAAMPQEILANTVKLQWEGKVVKIVGQKVFVNSGKASGIMPGDILRVMTKGEDLYEPGSDAFIGRSEGKLKGTLEVREYVGDDGAVATVHSGGQFQEGDTVRLY